MQIMHICVNRILGDFGKYIYGEGGGVKALKGNLKKLIKETLSMA
jgi:hypothetical protein